MRKGRKLDSLSSDGFFFSATIETLISNGLEYMLMMCLWAQSRKETWKDSEKKS